MIMMASNAALAAEEPLEIEFLEWLGASSEVENLGVDIDSLIQEQEQQGSESQSEESSQ